MASDNLLKSHLTQGASRRQQQMNTSSSGTLKAVKSLKAQLSRINHNAGEMSDAQLRELANIGSN